MRIGLVAGEASGDTLGAALIQALRRRFPQAEFSASRVRRCLPRVARRGRFDELAVMGLTEVVTHLPRLCACARSCAAILDGVPTCSSASMQEFNLGLARQLKRAGLATVQYVSPQVWAWRQGRVRTIGEPVDLVLCLLPFEPEFYREHGVRAAFVGHPLADQIPLEVDRAAARAELGCVPSARARGVARQPAWRSRKARRRIRRCGRVAGRARTGPCQHRAHGDARVARPVCRALRAARAQGTVRMLDGQARLALAAADVVLVASGTATLETALFRRPMVVAYKLGFITAFLLRTLGMVKIQHFSQPNLLAGKELVPEFFQEAASAENLADALSRWLEHPDEVARAAAGIRRDPHASALRWRRARRSRNRARWSKRGRRSHESARAPARGRCR